MADGTTKPLDQVKVGDKVEATNPETGKTSAQTVTTIWVNHDNDLMDVTVKSGGKTSAVHTTQHHLFWDASQNAWAEAGHLAAGDRLRTVDGTLATVVSTVIIPGAADMWDLTVQTSHDFYVVTATASILVHNCPVGGGNGMNLRGISDSYAKKLLRQINSDPHAFKEEFVGRKVVSRFDIKMGGNGELHLVSKDGGTVIPTGFFPEVP